MKGKSTYKARKIINTTKQKSKLPIQGLHCTSKSGLRTWHVYTICAVNENRHKVRDQKMDGVWCMSICSANCPLRANWLLGNDVVLSFVFLLFKFQRIKWEQFLYLSVKWQIWINEIRIIYLSAHCRSWNSNYLIEFKRDVDFLLFSYKNFFHFHAVCVINLDK